MKQRLHDLWRSIRPLVKRSYHGLAAWKDRLPVHRPFLWPVRWLFRQFCLRHDVRFLRINYRQMGHLALEPECYLKGRILEHRPRHAREVLLTTGWCGRVANRHMMQYWKEHFAVLDSKLLYFLYRVVQSDAVTIDIRLLKYPPDGTERFYSVIPRWGDRAALGELSTEDRQWGWRQLESFGMFPDDWFVCIHCREDGYRPNAEHSHRDADIATYEKAVREILDRGGWCIRVGEPSARPLSFSHVRIVDYARSRLKSARMDIFLCASCRFFLGNTSGLFCVASLFGRPCAQAHMVPMSCLPLTHQDIAIPKLIRCRESQRILSFPEVFDGPIANYQRSPLYEEHGLDCVENTAEEVHELTCEMLDRLEGKATYSDEDEERQRQFLQLVCDGHMGFGGVGRIGTSFLKRHEGLLSDPALTRRVGTRTPSLDFAFERSTS